MRQLQIKYWLMPILALLEGCSVTERSSAGSSDAESAKMTMSISRELNWDTLPNGDAVTRWILENSSGIKVTLIDYGATLVALEVPDREGKTDDIVLGFDSVAPYIAETSPFMGATVGRYANRIAFGKFSLDGKEYALATNDNAHHLHGGDVGFNRVLWESEPLDRDDAVGIRFRYLSKDGEEGYPGNLSCEVRYVLSGSELRIEYEAQTDAPTPINLTHHSYFNLAGAASGATILDHELEIEAAHYTPVDETLIPTGDIDPVEGTPLDFRSARAIGDRIEDIEGGYDHNFVLDSQNGSLTLAAKVVHHATGRVMEVRTTEPGLQFYTGNFLDGTLRGKGGTQYRKHSGFCLETQKYPDSPNRPEFPTSILLPGETYSQTTIYRFYTE